MPPRRTVKEDKGPSTERWLLTYSDLITLLMIFFVMMYVMSNVNAQKFQRLASVLAQAFGARPSGILTNAGNSILEQQISPLQPGNKGEGGGDIPAQNAAQLQEVAHQLEELLEQKNLGKRVTVRMEQRGLVISIQDTVLFPSGSASLTPEARGIIAKVGGILKPLPNYIRVEGHTDNLPIHTGQFPSNWELSSARATNVVRDLIEVCGIPPDHLSATGYGEYRPRVDNDSDWHRQMNRRVDILILSEIYQKVEPSHL